MRCSGLFATFCIANNCGKTAVVLPSATACQACQVWQHMLLERWQCGIKWQVMLMKLLGRSTILLILLCYNYFVFNNYGHASGVLLLASCCWFSTDGNSIPLTAMALQCRELHSCVGNCIPMSATAFPCRQLYPHAGNCIPMLAK